jgi:hypothetical protein
LCSKTSHGITRKLDGYIRASSSCGVVLMSGIARLPGINCYQVAVSLNRRNVGRITFALSDSVASRLQAAIVLFPRATLALTLFFFPAAILQAEAADPSAILPAPPAVETAGPATAQTGERILGVIPNYQTVNDSTLPVAPLTRRQKWSLAVRETMDPFNVANAVVGSGFSQMGNQTPKYGEGAPAFAKRFGAAWADLATQNFFSAGVLATVLHQDPRYYRRGPRSSVMKRVVYSVSRLAVTRQDSGRNTFNASGMLGMVMGIAASNAYYPSQSIRGEVMAARLSTSLTGGVIGNLMSEFWPDIQKKFFHKP